MTLIPVDISVLKCDCLQAGCAYCDRDGSRSRSQSEMFENLRKSMIVQYVAGFLFSEDMRRVALIKKTKPEWQFGKLNGIGGKVEKGETHLEAQKREFMEETGMIVDNWRYFCTIHGEFYDVKFYMAVGDVDKVTTTTEEKVVVVPVDNLGDVLPNLKWLIPMIIDLLDRSYNRNKHIDERINAMEVEPVF